MTGAASGALRATRSLATWAAPAALAGCAAGPVPEAESAAGATPPAEIRLKLRHAVRPVFPEFARGEHPGGCVILKFRVQPDGAVTDIEVMASRPPGVFEHAAIEALSQWRFEPFAAPPRLAALPFDFTPPDFIRMPPGVVRAGTTELTKEGGFVQKPCRVPVAAEGDPAGSASP